MPTTLPYAIRSGFDSMDFDRATKLLQGTSWCPGIRKSEVLQGARNSAVVLGAFTPAGLQVSFARVVSDKTRFAYLLDVVVDPAHRRRGIGQAMVSASLAHPDLKDVYQFVLLTRDAHGVYQKCGFKPLADPTGWLEIRRERPDRSNW
jgi:ribosomal protein S18 acetylase RimI-like enzyme